MRSDQSPAAPWLQNPAATPAATTATKLCLGTAGPSGAASAQAPAAALPTGLSPGTVGA